MPKENKTGALTLITSPRGFQRSPAHQNHLLLVREQRRANSGPEWKASRRPTHRHLTLDRGRKAMGRKQTVASNVKSAELDVCMKGIQATVESEKTITLLKKVYVIWASLNLLDSARKQSVLSGTLTNLHTSAWWRYCQDNTGRNCFQHIANRDIMQNIKWSSQFKKIKKN